MRKTLTLKQSAVALVHKTRRTIELIEMKRVLPFLLFVPCLTAAHAQAQKDPYLGSIDKLKAAQSLTGTMDITFPGTPTQSWKLRFLKPNLYEVLSPDQEFRSDGKKESVYLPQLKQFEYPQGGASIEAPFATGLNAFFNSGGDMKASGEKNVQLGDKTVVAVSLTRAGMEKKVTLYIDPQSLLPVGYDDPMDDSVYQVRYRDIKLNPPIEAASFAWSPPAGAKPIPENPGIAATLLKPQDDAPVLPATDIAGNMLNVAKDFKSSRATLLYFWGGELPLPNGEALKQLYGQLHDQKLQVMAIYYGNTADAQKALAAANFPFPIVVEDKTSPGWAKAYGITAPNEFEYIVGPDGKIVSNYIGHDPESLAQKLRTMGFRI